MQPNTEIIQQFLSENINRFSPIKLTVISVQDLTETLANDPGNELLYMATFIPASSDDYYSENEPCINIKELSDAMQELPIANGDHCLTVEQYIGMNTIMLLPITMLS